MAKIRLALEAARRHKFALKVKPFEKDNYTPVSPIIIVDVAEVPFIACADL